MNSKYVYINNIRFRDGGMYIKHREEFILLAVFTVLSFFFFSLSFLSKEIK